MMTSCGDCWAGFSRPLSLSSSSWWEDQGEPPPSFQVPTARQCSGFIIVAGYSAVSQRGGHRCSSPSSSSSIRSTWHPGLQRQVGGSPRPDRDPQGSGLGLGPPFRKRPLSGAFFFAPVDPSLPMLYSRHEEGSRWIGRRLGLGSRFPGPAPARNLKEGFPPRNLGPPGSFPGRRGPPKGPGGGFPTNRGGASPGGLSLGGGDGGQRLVGPPLLESPGKGEGRGTKHGEGGTHRGGSRTPG